MKVWWKGTEGKVRKRLKSVGERKRRGVGSYQNENENCEKEKVK